MPRLRIPDLPRRLRAIGEAATSAANDEIRTYAHDLRDRFVDRIRRQDFSSFRAIPLSWRWSNRKAQLNFDPRTMIASGAYLNSIRVYETATKDGIRLHVGIHPSVVVRHHRTGVTRRLKMWQLALIHEFGSSAARIPARPHWGPFFLETHAQDMPRMIPQLVRAVGRRMRRAVS